MSGKGRGRGWLQLGEIQNQPNTAVVNEEHNTQNNVNMRTYEKLEQVINNFSDSDDGILINQKFRYIKDTFNNFSTADEVMHAFNNLYNKAVKDTNFTLKFVIFTSLNTFRNFVTHEVNLRRILLQNMERDYKNVTPELLENERTIFYNTVRLFVGFYNKAMMATNTPYHIIAKPILLFFDLLLDSAKPEDIELFATQLYLVGAKILDANEEQLKETIVKARHLLITNNKLNGTSRNWLTLTADLHNSRYKVLSPELIHYYETKLGNKVVLVSPQLQLDEATNYQKVPQQNQKSEEELRQHRQPGNRTMNFNHYMKL